MTSFSYNVSKIVRLTDKAHALLPTPATKTRGARKGNTNYQLEDIKNALQGLQDKNEPMSATRDVGEDMMECSETQQYLDALAAFIGSGAYEESIHTDSERILDSQRSQRYVSLSYFLHDYGSDVVDVKPGKQGQHGSSATRRFPILELPKNKPARPLARRKQLRE